MCANNTATSWENVGENTETSTICRQQFANMLCRSHMTFEIANTSWPTFAYRVKAAQVLLRKTPKSYVAVSEAVRFSY